jgi:hypothetical protein
MTLSVGLRKTIATAGGIREPESGAEPLALTFGHYVQRLAWDAPRLRLQSQTLHP